MIAELPPAVDECHCSIFQLIQLFETDSQSPIFNYSPWPIVEKLRLEGHCRISRTTIYRYLHYHAAKGRVPDHSEGLQVGRPSRVDDRMVERLRAKVIENCGVSQHPTKML